MKPENRERVDTFLDQLEEAIPKSQGRREEVRFEVESDLLAMIDKGIESGRSETDSVDQALEEMGNPFELAYRISEVAAPTPSRAFAMVRYGVAGLILLWALYMGWHFRAWSYGMEASFHLAGIFLFHFPIVLLLWPRIVWRPNWLFGLIPAGIAVAVAMGVGLLGVQTSETIVLLETLDDGSQIAETISESSNGEMSLWAQWLLFAGLLGIFVVLTMAAQQARQRRLLLLVAGILFLAVEIPFRIEEGVFRRDWKTVQRFVESYETEQGRVPTKEVLKSEGPPLRNDSYQFYAGETGGYSMFWNRPLSSGFALIADSESDVVRVQD